MRSRQLTSRGKASDNGRHGRSHALRLSFNRDTGTEYDYCVTVAVEDGPPTEAEAQALIQAISHHCECVITDGVVSHACEATLMMSNQRVVNGLVWMRRSAARLKRGEWSKGGRLS